MKRVLALSAALALAACGGDSSSGGGTADSPLVGTYNGTSSVRVSASGGARSAGESIAIFVHQDGLVQFGTSDATIYASGPLQGDMLRIEDDAGALVDPECSGTITLSGKFTLGDAGKATFEGSWSSENVSCFGRPTDLEGTVVAGRVKPGAEASRVFETNSPALLEAFKYPSE